MTKRALVQLASRALALNLLLWSIYSFMYIPVYSFSLSHYARLTPTSASQEYLYRYYFYSFAVSCLYDHCDIPRGHLNLQVRTDDGVVFVA